MGLMKFHGFIDYDVMHMCVYNIVAVSVYNIVKHYIILLNYLSLWLIKIVYLTSTFLNWAWMLIKLRSHKQLNASAESYVCIQQLIHSIVD